MTSTPGTTVRQKTVDLPPTLLKNGIEASLHRLSKSSSIYKELCAMFPDIDEQPTDAGASHERFFIIPTCQKSQYDLIQIGVEIENEKDRLLLTFTQFARELVEKCGELRLWCDFIDPCSGYPMVHTDCQRAYDEVDNIQKLLKYKILPTNCCRVLHHPLWGSAVYPASIFIYIPQNVAVPVSPPVATATESSAEQTVVASSAHADDCLQYVLSQVLRAYLPDK